MSSSLELQAAIYARLNSWPSIQSISGIKVYDRVPAKAEAPYIELGNFDDRRDDKTCVSGRVIYVTIHAWSAYSTSRLEAGNIADAIESALNGADLTLPNHRLISMGHLRTQIFKDLDAIHFHGVIEFIARTET